MTLAGWALGELGLLFLGGAFVVTGLYLLRMRRRRVVVPFAALWEQVTRETETRRLWRRLRRLMSWLLQLLVLALVCLALGDPRPEVWMRDPVDLALVIDRSASMAGPDASGDGTRLDAALSRARAELSALGPADRAVVIAAGPAIEVPAPLGRDPSSQLAALETIGVQPGEADLGRALALARNVLADAGTAKILILTDLALDPGGRDAVERCVSGTAPACAVAPLSGPAPNVAITAFAARRYPGARDRVEALVEIHNLAETPARAILDVEADGLSIGRREIELEPGGRRREILPDLDAARARLVARLEPADGDPAPLGPAIDDVAWAVIPPVEPVEVALVTDGTDLFLEAALLTLDDHVRLTGVDPDRAEPDAPAIASATIVVYDVGGRPLPALPADKHLVVLDPHRVPGSSFPIARGRELVRPRLTEQVRNHPILQGVVFKDVNMSRGTGFSTVPGDQALVSHLGEPIIVLRESLERSLLGIGFDPRQSDLPLRVAFPLLIANTIDYFETRLPGFVAALPVGEDRELRLAELGLPVDGVVAVEISEPDAGPTARVRVHEGRFRMRAMVPGIHAVRAIGADGSGPAVEIAVNQASRDASNLAPTLGDLPEHARASEAPEPAPLAEGPLWTLVLLAIAAIVALEWASYHRRRTV